MRTGDFECYLRIAGGSSGVFVAAESEINSVFFAVAEDSELNCVARNVFADESRD